MLIFGLNMGKSSNNATAITGQTVRIAEIDTPASGPSYVLFHDRATVRLEFSRRLVLHGFPPASVTTL